MKIVFFVNSISNQRCIKRINEFVDKGYDLVVYAVSRKMPLTASELKFSYQYIAEYKNNLSYYKRFGILKKSILNIISKYGDSVVYYVFGLDIAIAATISQECKRYIYEESDLAHTYISNKLITFFLEIIDKWIIRHSILTVFTSKGFCKYHFGSKRPTNVVYIPNCLPPSVNKYLPIVSKQTDFSALKIGFVGKIRFRSVAAFAEFFVMKYPKFEFHFYGDLVSLNERWYNKLTEYPNCFFHGHYTSPNDLFKIYSNIDLVLSTYDVKCDNVRYLEPNKLYESIFFETPIIVSKDTYLAERVKELGTGYEVNPLDNNSIISLIESLPSTMPAILNNLRHIDKSIAINNNESFFNILTKMGIT